MPERALQLSDEMRQDEIQPKVATYNALISACGKGSFPETALQLFVERRQDGPRPNGITYSALISAYGVVVCQCGPCGSLMRCGRRDSSPM